MLPLEYPCGPESSCCAPVGQREEEIAALKKTLEAELAAKVQVINTADRRSVEEQPAGQTVRQLLASFGAQALPIIALHGEIVSMGSPSPQEAVNAIKEKMKL